MSHRLSTMGFLPFRGLLLAALALMAVWGPAWARSESGQTPLRGGATLTWRVEASAPAPVLGIAAPSHAAWAPEGLAKPVRILLRTNIAAFIDRWELRIARAGDRALTQPLATFSGLGESFPNALSWDGAPEAGPALRPGERLIATLRVEGPGGSLAETPPQEILIARYLMPRERDALDRESARRRDALDTPDGTAERLPVADALLTARIEDWSDPDPPRLSGLRLQSLGAGAWRLTQILPPGDYALSVQAGRPLLGGERLVPVGAAAIRAPGRAALLTPVEAPAELDLAPLDDEPAPRADLEPEGGLSGRAAARLAPAERDAPTARAALALVDPAVRYRLFRDAQGRRILETPLGPEHVFWPNPRMARAPVERTALERTARRRAVYPARPASRLVLPHTDILPESLRVVLKPDEGGGEALRPTADYDVEPHQGLLRFTEQGRAQIRALAREGGGGVAVAYRIRALAAALDGQAADGEAVLVEGDGSRFLRRNDGAPPPAPAADLALEDPTPLADWRARLRRWLSGR